MTFNVNNTSLIYENGMVLSPVTPPHQEATTSKYTILSHSESLNAEKQINKLKMTLCSVKTSEERNKLKLQISTLKIRQFSSALQQAKDQIELLKNQIEQLSNIIINSNKEHTDLEQQYQNVLTLNYELTEKVLMQNQDLHKNTVEIENQQKQISSRQIEVDSLVETKIKLESILKQKEMEFTQLMSVFEQEKLGYNIYRNEQNAESERNKKIFEQFEKKILELETTIRQKNEALKENENNNNSLVRQLNDKVSENNALSQEIQQHQQIIEEMNHGKEILKRNNYELTSDYNHLKAQNTQLTRKLALISIPTKIIKKTTTTKKKRKKIVEIQDSNTSPSNSFEQNVSMTFSPKSKFKSQYAESVMKKYG